MAGKNTQHDKAIAALLSGVPIYKAAEQAGVGERTLRRWLSENEQFKARYEQTRQQLFERNVSQLAELSGTAIQRLREILNDQKVSVRDRLSAIRICLDNARGVNAQSIEDRLSEIERALESGDVGGVL